jgi:hypothetical protein
MLVGCATVANVKFLQEETDAIEVFVVVGRELLDHREVCGCFLEVMSNEAVAFVVVGAMSSIR